MGMASVSLLHPEKASFFIRLWVILGALATPLALFGATPGSADSLNDWAAKQAAFSQRYLLDNISPPGAARGAVVASPSKTNPDYFYHWIRDSSIVMGVVVDLYRTAGAATKPTYYQMLIDYIDFSRSNQLTPNLSGGLGEPKFNTDGSAFNGAWGRPQNDGPALRAITLVRVANLWLDEGLGSVVKEKLYRAELPAYTVIKADLEFVSHHWTETCFDLWEETKGHHFYTQMVQRKSMIVGAQLADRMGDDGAAAWYRQQAKLMEQQITRFWDPGKGYLVATLDRDGGVDYKASGIDAGTLLGTLHGDVGDGFFSITEPKVAATAHAIEVAFQNLFPINHVGFPAVAIGRYPEDRYNGYGCDSQGDPWVLLTAAFSEYYSRLATAYAAQGQISVTAENLAFFRALAPNAAWQPGQTLNRDQAAFNQTIRLLRGRADDFLTRVRLHGTDDGRYNEQINRNTGYLQGADNLTWNYESLIAALRERPQ